MWKKNWLFFITSLANETACMPLLEVSCVSPCLLQTELESGSHPMSYIFVVLLAAESYARNGDDLAVLIKSCLFYEGEPSSRRTRENEMGM